MRNQRAMLHGLVMLSFFLAQGLAGGQDLPDIKTATTAKVGAVLSALYEEYKAHESRATGTDFESENPLIRIVENRVVIDAVASGDPVSCGRTWRRWECKRWPALGAWCPASCLLGPSRM